MLEGTTVYVNVIRNTIIIATGNEINWRIDEQVTTSIRYLISRTMYVLLLLHNRGTRKLNLPKICGEST